MAVHVDSVEHTFHRLALFSGCASGNFYAINIHIFNLFVLVIFLVSITFY